MGKGVERQLSEINGNLREIVLLLLLQGDFLNDESKDRLRNVLAKKYRS